jgi:dihydroorotate dehydrogenase
LVYNNTRLIKRVKKELGDNIKVIGGGGIYNTEIADMYLSVGSDYLSLSTALLSPFKLKRLINDINERF